MPGVRLQRPTFEQLGFAGRLRDWPGPSEGERPAAYIIILLDTELSKNAGCDHGIAAQSILLGAREMGLAGCMHGAVKKEPIMEAFDIQDLAMDRVIATSYELLGLISFFTVGEDEVKAWTIHKGTAAVDAAEVIHSDIKKGFIRAEVLAYDDLMAAGDYAHARKQGAVRLEGKTYPVQDGDIINFRFNV